MPRVARVRVMEVTHAAGHKRVERHGQPMMTKDVEVEYSPTYTYLGVEPALTEPTAALILTSVDYKTTLKGFGRQWRASLDANKALWRCELSRRARSGRFGILGAVAIVDDEHPVIVVQTGDVKTETRFNFSHPTGVENINLDEYI